MTGQAEFDHWAGAENDGFDANVRPLAENMTFIGDGGDVVSGITGMAAFGHTPGHMVYRLDSAGAGLVIFADLANHPVWSLARPSWEVRFDADKESAAASRRNVLGMIAADRIPAIGYHMPFPAMGFVEANGDDEIPQLVRKFLLEEGVDDANITVIADEEPQTAANKSPCSVGCRKPGS